MGSNSQRLKLASLIQIILSLIMVLFVTFAYILNLWDQDYLDKVKLDWSINPIIDVYISYVNVSSSDYFGIAPDCPDGFERGPGGRWYGSYTGCNCEE